MTPRTCKFTPHKTISIAANTCPYREYDAMLVTNSNHFHVLILLTTTMLSSEQGPEAPLVGYYKLAS